MNSGMDTKVTVGKVTVDVGQVLRNVTGVETDKEKKSFLQKILEPKEVDDSSSEIKKAEKIARKIARGESVTPQEKALLMRVDPKLAQMAELAHEQGERLKHSLQQASSKTEQQNIIQQAYQMVAQVSKKNPQFGELLGEAIKAAVQDSRKKGIFREEESLEVDDKNVEDKGEALPEGITKPESTAQDEFPGQDGQQALLEQFFPEEWTSIMDCKG
ncbi:MAG: hypothetical protein HFH37_08880 [Lachnospiraceae bacterium]|jgi:hypothetical protein|nr:hypothetical protein [Lachnospiraceae bacterium]